MKLLTWLWRRPGRKSGAQSKKILDTPNSHHRIAWVNSHGLSSPEYGRMDKVVPHLKRTKTCSSKTPYSEAELDESVIAKHFHVSPRQKCEKEFNEYMKDKMVAAKADFRELLKVCEQKFSSSFVSIYLRKMHALVAITSEVLRTAKLIMALTIKTNIFNLVCLLTSENLTLLVLKISVFSKSSFTLDLSIALMKSLKLSVIPNQNLKKCY